MASIEMLVITQSIILGLVATLFMDIFAWLREKLFQIKPLNYAFVGRWFLYWVEGKFIHDNIVKTPPKKLEYFWGWSIHYFTGFIFAYLYLMISQTYSLHGSFIYILIFALCTTLIPFILMQPALGFGFFARKTPQPLVSIKNSLIAHATFGVGLYLSYKFIMPHLT